MSVQNIQSVVESAANATLFTTVTVKGRHTYTFGSNLVSWDGANSYTMKDIAKNFGAVEMDENNEYVFRCADAKLNAFDFGLLFTCFTAISAAHVGQGASIYTLREDTNVSEIDVTWFGNNAVIYSKERNLIIPLTNAIIHNACKHEHIRVENFVDIRKFTLRRERLRLVLDTDRGEAVCNFAVPDFVQRSYPHLFNDDPSDDLGFDNPNTPWDDRSALGNLIARSMGRTNAEEVRQKYQTKILLDSVVVRDDLIFRPEKRYSSSKEFIGSICYSDKEQICLAVNLRENLFVHQPWFTGDLPSRIQVEPNPKLVDFYNVTEECTIIERYAHTVTNRPLTASEFSLEVFEKIKCAFYDMKLPRLHLAGCFGKVVIPESVLMQGLASTTGDVIYCIVPVGVIGRNVICKTSGGKLSAMKNIPTSEEEGFYDITEVLKNAV